MQQLAQKDLKLGQVVLTKSKHGYRPNFFVEWQFGNQFGVGPVCNWFLSYEIYGDFAVHSSAFCYREKLKIFEGNSPDIGDIVLVYQGGYGNKSDRNWRLAYYCAVMNGMIMAASFYNPKINKFTGIEAYPAMGKYIQ